MLRTQQEAKKNRVSVFGRFMPDLLRRVEEADRLGRFHKKPRGPFGGSCILTLKSLDYFLPILNVEFIVDADLNLSLGEPGGNIIKIIHKTRYLAMPILVFK